jgi:hypothetical protein
MDPVVPKARLTSNARFFGENIIVLALKITNNFLETAKRIVRSELGGRCRERARRVVVYVVTETRSVDDSEGDSNTVFFELYNGASTSNPISRTLNLRTDQH